MTSETALVDGMSAARAIGIDEIGKRADTGEIVIRVDKRYYRPTEVDELLGDSSKAREELGWIPKIKLEELVSEMIEEDIKLALKEKTTRDIN